MKRIPLSGVPGRQKDAGCDPVSFPCAAKRHYGNADRLLLKEGDFVFREPWSARAFGLRMCGGPLFMEKEYPSFHCGRHCNLYAACAGGVCTDEMIRGSRQKAVQQGDRKERQSECKGAGSVIT